MPFSEDRFVLALSDGELEDLVKKWLARLQSDYVGFERPTASADMGRDAVGFLSQLRYDGEWDNYQCKQLKVALGTDEFVVKLGKIFHYHCKGEFTLPRKYIFVAPNAAVRDVKHLIDKPSKIGPFLLNNWARYCLNGISKSPTPLTAEIVQAISSYEFHRVELWKASELVEMPHMRALLSEVLDIDPGAAPTVADCDVPAEAEDYEQSYVGQLLEVFGEHKGAPFTSLGHVAADGTFGPQMNVARRRYLEHRAFKRHFRDNLPVTQIEAVDRDVHDGVVDRYHQLSTGPSYDRLVGIMSEASKVTISGPLGKHNRVTVSVKQGACHHFANTGKLPWK